MFPLRPLETGGWVVYTFIVIFSNFSGMAGGLPLVVFMGMFDFTMKASIPLSNSNIFSSAMVRLIVGAKDPHPLRKKGNLLNFSIVTMMFPMITVGALISSFSSPAIPDIFIVIGFVVILIGT